MQAVTAGIEEEPNEIEEVLKLFGGDARKALSTVLSDCHHLHEQLRLTSGAVSVGFTRGSLPGSELWEATFPGLITDRSNTLHGFLWAAATVSAAE